MRHARKEETGTTSVCGGGRSESMNHTETPCINPGSMTR